MGNYYYLYILGCQMNYSDAEKISTILENLGYIPSKDFNQCDLLIYVTCSIRQKAEDRVYGHISNVDQLRNLNPNLKVGITGCMVRKTSTRNSPKNKKDELLNRLEQLDFVFRIEDLMQLPEIMAEAEVNPIARDFADANVTDYLKIAAKHSSRFQAFVPIQTGCDKFCTYCIVPFSRGREWSRDMPEIIEECQHLGRQGYKEITLVGQTVNSYGLSSLDKKSGKFEYNGKIPFTQLLEKLNQIDGIRRIRFISPHPVHMSDDLINGIASLDKLCPYIHLPIQSGDDNVLKSMNRTYTVDQYRCIIEKIRKKMPNCAISTDIIVGFSGETEEQFRNTCELYEDIQWDQAYIARYSPRKGTFAAQRLKDDISRTEKAQRWHALNEILIRISHEKNKKFLGKTVEVLVEKYQNDMIEGRSEHYKSVRCPGSQDQVGNLIKVKITEARELCLAGSEESK